MKHYRCALILFGFVFVGLLSTRSHGQVRTWVDHHKNEVQATFLGLDSAFNVELKRTDKSIYKCPFVNLSTVDQDFVFKSLSTPDQDRLAWHLGSEIPGIQVGVRGTGRQPTRSAQRKWVFLVSVMDYANLPNLKYCNNDIYLLRKRFLNLGFEKSNVIVLSNDQSIDRQPTRKNINSWMERILLGQVFASEKGVIVRPRLCGENDMIIFAFSGHGVLVGGQSYFCPPGADVRRPDKTMISMDKVYDKLGRVSNGLRLLLVDACRDIPEEMKNVKPLTLSKTFQNGLVAISSCSPGQVSFETEKLALESKRGHGVFFFFLQFALAGAAEPESNSERIDIRLNQLIPFVVDRTSTYSTKVLTMETPQTPEYRSSISGNPAIGTLHHSNRIDRALVESFFRIGPGIDPELYFEVVKPNKKIVKPDDKIWFDTLNIGANGAQYLASKKIQTREAKKLGLQLYDFNRTNQGNIDYRAFGSSKTGEPGVLKRVSQICSIAKTAQVTPNLRKLGSECSYLVNVAVSDSSAVNQIDKSIVTRSKSALKTFEDSSNNASSVGSIIDAYLSIRKEFIRIGIEE